MRNEVKVVDHPLIQHKLTQMRRKDTPSAQFRKLLREISLLMAYEVTRDLPLTRQAIETPVTGMDAPVLRPDHKLCFVSILRAGNGILEGMLDLLPEVPVGHVGIYRDPATLQAVEYYFKMPADAKERIAIVFDPMLATGHSSAAAVARVKASGVRGVKFVSLLAAPEGAAYLSTNHPDVPIYTAAMDERLNDHGYIVPGLGDAGDRIYGTK